MNNPDVVIIGGGVMGMMTARELSRGGARVRLLEKAQPAAEASWAGGGIVSPLYPWRYSDAITALASWSQHSYVALSAALREETGIDPELRQKGLLMLAVEDEAEALAWAARCQRPVQQVDAEVIYRLESRLPAGLEQALWMPEVSSIRNPRLGQSLRRSLELDANVELTPDCPVTGVRLEAGRVSALRTPAGDMAAGQYLLCAGAWSGELARHFDQRLRIEPVKGQMLLFKAEPGLLERVVLVRGRYLIPRSDGRILVGSTLEFEGFNKQATEKAYRSLYQSAVDIMPALANYPVEAQWAGLRPGAPSGIPYIGALPGLDNCYTNAGHFRNGLVLAPASCRLAADLLLGRPPIIDPAPYRHDAERPDSLY